MAAILESLLAAPNATALNAKLKAAGSLRWLQQSGKLWQPMRGDEVVGWPADFYDARQVLAQAVEEDTRWKDEGPA